MVYLYFVSPSRYCISNIYFWAKLFKLFFTISKMFHVCTFSAICSTGEGGSSSRPLGKRGNQWLLFCSQFNNNVDERSAELPSSSAWNVIIQPRQTAFSAQGVFLAKICTVLSPLSTVHKMFRLSTEIYQMCTTVSWGGKTRLYSCYERKTYQKNDQKNCKLQMWLFPQYDATACPSFFYQGFIWCWRPFMQMKRWLYFEIREESTAKIYFYFFLSLKEWRCLFSGNWEH